MCKFSPFHKPLEFLSRHQQLKKSENVESLVKKFGAVDGIMSIKTHFKGDFGFNGILNIAFLFME